jgi:hypothetical protein
VREWRKWPKSFNLDPRFIGLSDAAYRLFSALWAEQDDAGRVPWNAAQSKAITGTTSWDFVEATKYMLELANKHLILTSPGREFITLVDGMTLNGVTPGDKHRSTSKLYSNLDIPVGSQRYPTVIPTESQVDHNDIALVSPPSSDSDLTVITLLSQCDPRAGQRVSPLLSSPSNSSLVDHVNDLTVGKDAEVVVEGGLGGDPFPWDYELQHHLPAIKELSSEEQATITKVVQDPQYEPLNMPAQMLDFGNYWRFGKGAQTLEKDAKKGVQPNWAGKVRTWLNNSLKDAKAQNNGKEPYKPPQLTADGQDAAMVAAKAEHERNVEAANSHKPRKEVPNV